MGNSYLSSISKVRFNKKIKLKMKYILVLSCILGAALAAPGHYAAPAPVCTTTYDRQCVPGTEKKCTTVNEQQCSTAAENKCETYNEQVCSTTSENKCAMYDEQQ